MSKEKEIEEMKMQNDVHNAITFALMDAKLIYIPDFDKPITEYLQKQGYGKVEDYKKEIENLKEENEILTLTKNRLNIFDIAKIKDEERQQSIKEFSEKLKKRYVKNKYNLVVLFELNDLLKEYGIGE